MRRVHRAMAWSGLCGGLLLAFPAAAAGAPTAVAPTVARRPLDRGLTVKVAAGETLEDLALRYYGSTSVARAILLANRLPGWGRRLPRLRPGQTLRLPTAWSYRIRPGDSWAGLAADYLGDMARGPFLARLNGKAVTGAAPAGHVILLPAVVAARVPPRPSLPKLAALLLDLPERDARVRVQAGWIRDYNDLGRGRLHPGKPIHLPLPSLRLLGWYLPTALPRRDPGSARRAAAALQEAGQALRKGRYLEAVERLGPVLGSEGLPPALRAEIHLARCTAFVALGRRRLALVAARAALAAHPGLRLDPVQVSPKVRAVFRRAAGGSIWRRRPRRN